MAMHRAQRGRDWRRSWGVSLVIVLLVTLAGIVGCGGGTSGTGIEIKAVLVRGVVLDESQAPVAFGTVRLVDSDTETPLNRDGSFSFVTDIPEDGVTLLVDLDGLEKSVHIPADLVVDQELNVVLVVRFDTGSIELRVA